MPNFTYTLFATDVAILIVLLAGVLWSIAVPELSPVRRGNTSDTARRTDSRLGRHHAWRAEQRRAQVRLRVGWTLPIHAEPAVRGRRDDFRRCEPYRELFVTVDRSRAAHLRIRPCTDRRGTLVGATVRTGVPPVSTSHTAILASVARRADMIARFIPWHRSESNLQRRRCQPPDTCRNSCPPPAFTTRSGYSNPDSASTPPRC